MPALLCFTQQRRCKPGLMFFQAVPVQTWKDSSHWQSPVLVPRSTGAAVVPVRNALLAGRDFCRDERCWIDNLSTQIPPLISSHGV